MIATESYTDWAKKNAPHIYRADQESRAEMAARREAREQVEAELAKNRPSDEMIKLHAAYDEAVKPLEALASKSENDVRELKRQIADEKKEGGDKARLHNLEQLLEWIEPRRQVFAAAFKLAQDMQRRACE